MQTITTDLLVLGESAGGIVAAVHAAREGLDVILVTYKNNLGGVMPSLGAIETHYAGVRTPMLTEIKERIVSAYRTQYGVNSVQYKTCTSLEADNPMITYEPHILEQIFAEMLEEAGIAIYYCYFPESINLSHNLIKSVAFQSFLDSENLRINAKIFMDCTYEGDLMALAGVPFRYGREAREDYHELHAGKIFTRWDFSGQKYPIEATYRNLNIMPKFSTQGIYSGSTGEGDDRIQAYSYRLCITNNPKNRVLLSEPPPNYQRDNFLAISLSPDEIGTSPYALHHRFLNNTLRGMIEQDQLFHGHTLPNKKRSWNATNYPGGNHGYLTADYATRAEIAETHLNHALGILYFLQNDLSIPDDIRQEAQEWGLAKDEFVAHNNIPPQLYVREGRRMLGRTTFTEADNMIAASILRAPIHMDSIGITEFPIDSLACSTERMQGTLCDGQFFLMELSRPGQIPFRLMFPEQLDNLIVPVATSSTHVAWGTVRQTATLIHISESAAIAAVSAVRQKIAPGQLNPNLLQHKLLEADIMISFFNDVDMSSPEAYRSGIQYFGTKGFFDSYDANPQDSLDTNTARQWLLTSLELIVDSLDPMKNARALHKVASGKPNVTANDLSEMIQIMYHHFGFSESPFQITHGNQPLSRGEACALLYRGVKDFQEANN